MKTSILSFFLLFLLPTFTRAQEADFSGTVVAFQKFPLKNVLVTAKKSKMETHTDEEGKFHIPVTSKDVVEFSANGFAKYKVKVQNAEEDGRFNLVYLNNEKNMAVAVEHDHISRDNLVYGVTNLEFDNTRPVLYSSIYQMVTDKVPGVQLIYEGGSPQFQIRGNKSLTQSSAALILVNGVATEDISFLAPTDVESITILKGPGASLYGARGGNGVISIKTK